MIAVIGFAPMPPLLLPELSAAPEAAELRHAVLEMGAVLADRVGPTGTATVVAAAPGHSDEPHQLPSDLVGTFAGYGVDVVVRATADARSARPDPMAPLPALVADWLRGQVLPHGDVRTVLVPTQWATPQAEHFGSELAELAAAEPEPTALLVLADGANTLTARAPGGLIDEALPWQRQLDDALAAGDARRFDGLRGADARRFGVTSLPAYRAGLAAIDHVRRTAGPGTVTEYYRGAPFGVGYWVGTWTS